MIPHLPVGGFGKGRFLAGLGLNLQYLKTHGVRMWAMLDQGLIQHGCLIINELTLISVRVLLCPNTSGRTEVNATRKLLICYVFIFALQPAFGQEGGVAYTCVVGLCANFQERLLPLYYAIRTRNWGHTWTEARDIVSWVTIF